MTNLSLDGFTLEAILRLVLAVVAGALVGLERERGHRPAGLRTHTLVCLGSCIVMVGSLWYTRLTAGDFDPLRMSAQVISGIGFLGAGTIIKSEMGVRGLTTAASLWVVACIGLALGMGFYWGAAIATVLTYAALAAFKRIEDQMEHIGGCRLQIRARAEDGLVQRILDAVTSCGMEIAQIRTESEDGYVYIRVVVKGEKVGELPIHLIEAVTQIPGVLMVRQI